MLSNSAVDPESRRLQQDSKHRKNWKRWGPYLSERQWGTVREDYSEDGACWDYFSHQHARSRAYRWGEDGLLGITDRECRMCFSLALWNGKDPFLKERLFGLTNSQGNHGEDVKECYYYQDSTPTHSYMRALYKYPQQEFPYQQLIDENQERGPEDGEYELTDTGIFDDNRYFDVTAEYGKAGPNDMLVRITVANRGEEEAEVHLLPTLWFRNTWSWADAEPEPEAKKVGKGKKKKQTVPLPEVPLPEVPLSEKPRLALSDEEHVLADHHSLGEFQLAYVAVPGQEAPQVLFTENDTNLGRVPDVPSAGGHAKDAFHDFVVREVADAVNPNQVGTKAAVHYVLKVPAKGSVTVYLRLFATAERPKRLFGPSFDQVLAKRMAEADAFFGTRISTKLSPEEYRVSRQAYAGLMWSKQFYHYVVSDWLVGDSKLLMSPEARKKRRNSDWSHLYNRDVISMPDKWEFPWYAAWDLAFHMIPLAQIDPRFAKEQLQLFLREWYMHPNGQIPAYEFALGDVNPPVHAWACWQVYKQTAPRGKRDQAFLASCFQKLLINFTWWVNQKDPRGKHLFSGGFLGLDNIGVFDRSSSLPSDGHLEQADGTAWMAFYCVTMLDMALELALHDPVYEDMASKFFEHFVHIADAMNTLGGTGLWDEQDGFYYDEMLIKGEGTPLRVRSMVGIIPLYAVLVLEDKTLERLPGFRKRLEWFLTNRPELGRWVSYMEHTKGSGPVQRRLLGIPSRDRLQRVLSYVLDEKEFLSPFGIRSLSRVHLDQPFECELGEEKYRVGYEPGESSSQMFGGNSNWRGPIWFPLNYLLIDALQRWHYFYGDEFKVECPTGSGNLMNLKEVSQELAGRLSRLFIADKKGVRPWHGAEQRYAKDPHWKDLTLFYEHFHGDTGRGLGASHQTGWTALITCCLEELANDGRRPVPFRVDD